MAGRYHKNLGITFVSWLRGMWYVKEHRGWQGGVHPLNPLQKTSPISFVPPSPHFHSATRKVGTNWTWFTSSFFVSKIEAICLKSHIF